jgi:catechol 2,3-dioxygenase-like lactoylglutathione lyase family enzyme
MIACLNERTLRIFATSSPQAKITAVKIVLAKPLGPVRLTVIPLRQKITPQSRQGRSVIMKLQKVYHMGIPVDNLDRAKDFYTQVLGMEYLGRVGGNPNNPDSFPIHGVAQKLDRFKCGNDDVVLFERPRPIERDALDEDGIFHQAFDMAWEDYDDALKTAKELGRFHRSVERDSGNTIYMFDSEGNYLELHFPRPGGRRQRQAN